MANGFYAGFVAHNTDCTKLDSSLLRLKFNRAKALQAYNTRFFQYAGDITIDFYTRFIRAYEYMIDKYGMDSDGY